VGTEARARVALAALLFFTLWTFAEVFRGGEYPGPTLLGMLLAGGIALVTRRVGLSAAASFLVSAIALTWYVCLVFASSATFYGLPTSGSVARLAHWIAEAAQKSNTDAAPAPVRPGYVIMVVVGMWIAGSIGETAAFRWQRPLLAALPCIALFSLVLVVGTGTATPVLVAAFLTVLLTFWGFESSNRLRSWGRWVPTWPGHPEEPPPQITGSLARRMATWCVAGAFITPLLLPVGRGLVEWRNATGGSGGGGSGGVSTIDPLVSIAPTLLKQTNEELLQVETDTPSYWRLQTLAAFDGTSWGAASQPVNPIEGSIHILRAPTGNTQDVVQTFHLTHLQTRFLPAAVNPTAISFGGVGAGPPSRLLADPVTGDIELDEPNPGGLTYEVHSAVPTVGYRSLKRDRIGEPGAQYLQLPEKLSQSVVDLAREWTAGATTPLDKLLAIQRHLRAFRYKLDVKPEASSDYLTAFLTRIKAGYCQQFATAFTILARLEGFPTRIAVGFLPGSQSSGNQTFVVRGSDAHAWPEVYFAKNGWLRFEPTPRLAAAVPAYGRIPTNAGPGSGGGRSGGGAGAGPAVTRGGRGGQYDKSNVEFQRAAGGGAAVGRRRHAAAPPEWEKDFARFGRALVALCLLVLIAIPVLKAARTRWRYARAGGAQDLAEAAFAQFEEEAAELAEPRARSESAGAYVQRLLVSRHLSARAGLALARIYERAEYSAAGIADLEAEEAKRLARQLRIDLWSTASWWDRAERLFSPKTLTRRP
jgi:transglutaminase-like putative cysteine protease